LHGVVFAISISGEPSPHGNDRTCLRSSHPLHRARRLARNFLLEEMI
jgi:hypothetical protein